MCRWMAYRGSSILLEDLLFKAEHSLIDQSMSSKCKETPTNGDGFGVGWYGRYEQPGLFRSIRPAWNDLNLRDLAAHVDSPLFLAHVRASSLATIQETNCHPFRHGKWLFVHNGELEELDRYRRELYFGVEPTLFNQILGSTDSELMFYLALSFGLESDPIGGLERMAGFVEKIARDHGVDQAVWMTLGVSDGKQVFAVRYASDSDAPTLYHTHDTHHLYQLNQKLRGRLLPKTRLIVSEPIGTLTEKWTEIPQNTAVTFNGDKPILQEFRPCPPA
jgi:predicted glutamine amidotransferase